MQEVNGILSLLQQDDNTSEAKTYVITGATSGIGLEAAKLIVMMNPMNRLFVVGRNERKARAAVREILSVLPQPKLYKDNLVAIACDHSSFDSVRKFSIDLRRKLDESYDPQKWAVNGVDVLCLNAAILMPKDVPPQFTRDNLEIAFQTNHLSPFLLVNLIHGMLNPGGRVVVSSSGLYIYQKLVLDGITDPETGHARKRFVTADGSEYSCKKCYAFSKMCNVAMAAELHERLQAMDVTVVCFSPGLIRQTGLFRYHRQDHPLKPKDFMRNEKTVNWGAGALAYMATSEKVGKMGCKYWHDAHSAKGPCAVYGQDFGPEEISSRHISEAGRLQLWNLSCELTGISSDAIPMHSQQQWRRSRTARLHS